MIECPKKDEKTAADNLEVPFRLFMTSQPAGLADTSLSATMFVFTTLAEFETFAANLVLCENSAWALVDERTGLMVRKSTTLETILKGMERLYGFDQEAAMAAQRKIVQEFEAIPEIEVLHEDGRKWRISFTTYGTISLKFPCKVPELAAICWSLTKTGKVRDKTMLRSIDSNWSMRHGTWNGALKQEPNLYDRIQVAIAGYRERLLATEQQSDFECDEEMALQIYGSRMFHIAAPLGQFLSYNYNAKKRMITTTITEDDLAKAEMFDVRFFTNRIANCIDQGYLSDAMQTRLSKALEASEQLLLKLGYNNSTLFTKLSELYSDGKLCCALRPSVIKSSDTLFIHRGALDALKDQYTIPHLMNPEKALAVTPNTARWSIRDAEGNVLLSSLLRSEIAKKEAVVGSIDWEQKEIEKKVACLNEEILFANNTLKLCFDIVTLRQFAPTATELKIRIRNAEDNAAFFILPINAYSDADLSIARMLGRHAGAGRDMTGLEFCRAWSADHPAHEDDLLEKVIESRIDRFFDALISVKNDAMRHYSNEVDTFLQQMHQVADGELEKATMKIPKGVQTRLLGLEEKLPGVRACYHMRGREVNINWHTPVELPGKKFPVYLSISTSDDDLQTITVTVVDSACEQVHDDDYYHHPYQHG